MTNNLYTYTLYIYIHHISYYVLFLASYFQKKLPKTQQRCTVIIQLHSLLAIGNNKVLISKQAHFSGQAKLKLN